MLSLLQRLYGTHCVMAREVRTSDPELFIDVSRSLERGTTSGSVFSAVPFHITRAQEISQGDTLLASLADF